MNKNHEAILAQLSRDSLTAVELMRATGLNKNQIHNGLQRLKDKGRIAPAGDGRYRIEDAPEPCDLPMVERAIRRAHPLHTIWAN